MPEQHDNQEKGLFDTFTEWHVWFQVAAIVVGSAGALWLIGVQWLIQHQVLLAAAAHPMLTLPYADGAGLDLPRITIVGCVATVALAYLISSTRRSVELRRYQ